MTIKPLIDIHYADVARIYREGIGTWHGIMNRNLTIL